MLCTRNTRASFSLFRAPFWISMGLWVLGFIKRIYIFTTHRDTHDTSHDTDNCNRGPIPIPIFFSSPTTYCIPRCRCGLMMTTHALYYEPSYDATRWMDSSSLLTPNFFGDTSLILCVEFFLPSPVVGFPPICSAIEVPATCHTIIYHEYHETTMYQSSADRSRACQPGGRFPP